MFTHPHVLPHLTLSAFVSRLSCLLSCLPACLLADCLYVSFTPIDNKFSSFQRQLNLYGFRKVVKGRESGCYMHPSFLRDNPEKLSEVGRHSP